MADDRDTLAESLTAGPTFPFSDGLHQTLPLAACGVYTIWKASEFLYVGVAGRGLDPAISHTKRKGLKTGSTATGPAEGRGTSSPFISSTALSCPT
jgi:hypothetical protein